MPPQDRPNGYGLIDDTLSNQPAEYPRELPEAGTGWPDGSTPRAKEFNHTLTRHAKWIQRYDQQALIHPLFLGLGTTRLTLDAFEYSLGAGLEATAVADSAYVVIGYVVDLSLTELENRTIRKHTFTASKDTHHYVSTSSVFRFEIVNIGVGPAPNADELWLGTMTTNATDRTVWTSGTDEPTLWRVRSTGLPWSMETPVTMRSRIDWIAANGTQRVHRRQNPSAGNVGFSLVDTVTRQGVTGNGTIVPIIPSQFIPEDCRIMITLQVIGVEGDAIAFWASAEFRAFYRQTAGTLSLITGGSPIDNNDNGAFANAVLLADAGGIAMRADYDNDLVNLEFTFTASIVTVTPP
jgi:hypothetical protein